LDFATGGESRRLRLCGAERRKFLRWRRAAGAAPAGFVFFFPKGPGLGVFAAPFAIRAAFGNRVYQYVPSRFLRFPDAPRRRLLRIDHVMGLHRAFTGVPSRGLKHGRELYVNYSG